MVWDRHRASHLHGQPAETRQIVMAGAAASPRCDDGEKKALRALAMVGATTVEGVLRDGGRLQLECRLERVVDDLGADGLLLGRIVAAHADRKALRRRDVPDGTLVHEQPLLAYLHPSQFALIHSAGLPFPKDSNLTAGTNLSGNRCVSARENRGRQKATKRDQPDQACGLRKVGLFARLAVDLLQASRRSSRHIARLLGIGIGAVLRVLVYHREPMVQPESSAVVTLR